MSIHCISCLTEIPIERLKLVKNTSRCASCQEKYESSNPESIARTISDDSFGSRNDFNIMRGRQNFGNKTGNH